MKKEYTTFEEKINQSFRFYGWLPLAGIIVLLFIVMFFISLNNNYYKPYKTQRLIEKNFNTLVDQVDNYITSIELTPEYKELFSDNNIGRYQYNYIYYQLSQITGMQIDYAFYHNNGEPIYVTKNNMDQDFYISIYNQMFVNRLQNNPYPIQVGTVYQEKMNSNENALVLGRKITIDDQEASFILYIDPSSLTPLTEQYIMNHLVVTDSFGYVITTTSKSYSDSLKKFNSNQQKTISIDNLTYQDNTYDFLNGQLRVHALIQKQNFFAEYGLLISFMVLSFLTLKYANQLVGKRVGAEVSQSITELVDAIDKLRSGEMGYQTSFQADDEMGYLIEEFNALSRDLDQLMKRNKDLQELKNEAQIKQLEAQFNPHFLYNSLETIRFLIIEDPKKATDLIVNLNYLLRYSLDVNKSEVLFSEDFEYVMRYLEIIKVRLNDRFHYSINIDDEVKSAYVPRLLIQPLIENSVKHGFRNKATLNIYIYGFEYNDSIYIGVHDDGGGMSQEKLAEVLKNINRYDNPKNSFGLHNLNQRLRLLYGVRSELRITSNDDGTNIVIRLPKEKVHV